jgi:hypothetical protein
MVICKLTYKFHSFSLPWDNLSYKHFMKIGALVILSLVTIAGYSQTSQNTINNYKYVLVPQHFEFLKSDDQYSLNSTTRSLLEQKGFTVYWVSDALPPSLAANRCAALVADVSQRKAMFTTNLTLQLKDCAGNVIFKGKEGHSREKEFYVAYDEALKDAFTSLNATPYKYDSTLAANTQPQQTQPQQTQTPQSQPQQTQTPQSQPQQTASQQSQTQQTASQQSASQQTLSPAIPAAGAVIGVGTLYAQPIPNGYQLVDLTPKKILTLLKTTQPDFYLAQAGAVNGIVFKKDGQWLFDYYKDDRLISQKLEVKF